MDTPNLFSFATSELSQDAFLCWFISWADVKYKLEDEELHNCAQLFIKEIFKKHSLEMPAILNLEVKKQDKNIDVLCIINNKFVLIIEDKTGTKNHSGQLSRYYTDVKSRGYKETDILPIYYKTEDQSCYLLVESNGYKPFLRKCMLTLLLEYNGSNNILIDYRLHLEHIEKKVNSYKHLPINKWNWHSWIGFYLYLQKALKKGNWDYVANPKGGFLGFWWHGYSDKECEQYLQLEEEKLCFKIKVDNISDRKKLRLTWHKRLNSQFSEIENFNIIKPSRFGSGKYMTVCICEKDYRITDDNNIINLDETVKLLKEAERILTSSQGIA